ncbi:hypothetical protein [Arcanobacterium haemolyticum]
MTISNDRANLARVLAEALEPLKMNVLNYAPASVSGRMAWIEPLGTVPGTTFGNIQITWQLTITGSAKSNVIEQQRKLDKCADAVVQAVTDSDAADLKSISEYFAIAEPTNGAAYPAARITLVSYTSIKENQ